MLKCSKMPPIAPSVRRACSTNIPPLGGKKGASPANRLPPEIWTYGGAPWPALPRRTGTQESSCPPRGCAPGIHESRLRTYFVAPSPKAAQEQRSQLSPNLLLPFFQQVHFLCPSPPLPAPPHTPPHLLPPATQDGSSSKTTSYSDSSKSFTVSEMPISWAIWMICPLVMG